MRILISILIFISWLGISIKWYVCGIKKLCDTEVIKEPIVSESKEVTGNFVFYPKSDTPIVNEQSYRTRDSLIQMINDDFDAKLEIVGLYYTDEQQESIANNRAKNVYNKMFANVDSLKVMFGASVKEPNQMVENKLFKGVAFNVINSVMINFVHNQYKSDLSSVQIEQIKNIINKSKEYDKKIIIEGHTDNVGSANYNLALSKKRANWLKSEILQYGIDENKIEIQAKGLTQPIATNDTEEGKQKNRRTIIIN